MELIQQRAEWFTPEKYDLDSIYEQIERCARVCYKSEPKGDPKEFVDRLIKNGHTAMLEHGTVYLIIKWWHIIKFIKYLFNPYSKIRRYKYITTNLRVLVEKDWLDDLKYIVAPTALHRKRYSLKFTTSIGITRELIRHRKFSFANESTRYCNYSKDKFDSEITFIEPWWLSSDKVIDSMAYDNAYELFVSSCEEAEGYYMTMLDSGFKPQDAREFLPLATKSEIVMTGFQEDWIHFFNLRLRETTGKAHPDMKNLAWIASKLFENRSIVV